MIPWHQRDIPLTEADLPPKDVFASGRDRRFGRANPEIMTVPFWTWMVQTGLGAYSAETFFIDDVTEHLQGPPVWCFNRLGTTTHTLLMDRWLISIGGEHEDGYDPHFLIYNDVVVRDFNGGVAIFGYPRDVFPPTDFHTATLIDPPEMFYEEVDDSTRVIIIGGLGYPEDREWWRTPVYELRLKTMEIHALELRNEEPGWLWKHEAQEIARHRIRVWGGERLDENGKTIPNDRVFELDLDARAWFQVGGHAP